MRASLLAITAMFALGLSSFSAVAATGDKSTINLDSNGQMHLVELTVGERTIKVFTQDGAMSTIALNKGSKFRFMAKTNSSTSQVEIRPIKGKQFIKEGNSKMGLTIAGALEKNEVTIEMKLAEIDQVKYVSSVPLEEWKAAREARRVERSKGAISDAAQVRGAQSSTNICMQPAVNLRNALVSRSGPKADFKKVDCEDCEDDQEFCCIYSCNFVTIYYCSTLPGCAFCDEYGDSCCV